MRLITLLLIFFISNAHCASLIKEEQVKLDTFTMVISKIEFEGHTFIHFKNPWSYAGNKIMHDPNCQCLVKIKHVESDEIRK